MWNTYRNLQRRLELARKNVEQQEPLVQAYEKRYKAGVANSYPGYYQLKSNLDNTRALVPQLEISLRQANNQLCTLLGIPVRDLLPELGDGTVPERADPTKHFVRIPQPADPSVNATPDLSYGPWPQLPTDAMRASTLPGSPSIRPSLPSGLRHTKVGVPFRPIAVAIAMFWRRRCAASALGELSTPPMVEGVVPQSALRFVALLLRLQDLIAG